MPTFKVRTYEENREVIADKLEFCPDGIRLYTGGKVTAAFSRYLWVEEVTATEKPAEPEVPTPEPEVEPTPDPTPEPAPDAQPE